MPPTSFAAAPPDRVIPDCCNTGVIFRTLLVVNGTVLVTSVLFAGNLAQGLAFFLGVAMLVELSCLLSLIGLCSLRQPVAVLSVRMQRLACIAIPALVTGAVAGMLSGLPRIEGALAPVEVTKAMVVAALFGSILQHYFELRVRAFSPALVEARLQALQARIRPHFLFNSLNAVLSLIRTEPRRAEETLEDLAEMFRALMRDAREMTTIAEEIRFCRQYLSIEKIRLGERLQVQWKLIDITENVLGRAQIPALLLQPLLENAVHHGVEPSSDQALISIRFGRSIDRIEIVITNPYHGVSAKTAGNHMALENIRERLVLLYDVEGHLSTRVVDGLFEVRLRFPYVKADAKGVKK